MNKSLGRSIGSAAALVGLIAAPLIGIPGQAWAEVVAPTPAAGPTSSELPKGCTGLTPRKPWRLVVTRPVATGTAVNVDWSAVGCTTGYRVNVTGSGVDRHIDVPGGTSASLTIPDLPATQNYTVSVTSIGAAGDGASSGDYHLHRSGQSARAELTVDFPDAGPTEPTMPSANGLGPWINPVLTWTAPVGAEPKEYRVRVLGRGGTVVVDKSVSGSTTSTRLGDEMAAGVSYTATITPILADGTEDPSARLVFGNRNAPSPQDVTGNAPVIQFTPVAAVEEGRVLGYEVAFGPLQATKHIFVPASMGASAPWVALDPTFAGVDTSASALPVAKLVAIVRTITTMGVSPWTSAKSIAHSEVATADSAFFAGIGHLPGGSDTVPRNGFLRVHGSAADLQLTDLVWSQSRRQQAVDVTVSVYGPTGALAFTQQVPVTHLHEAAQDAWRVADLPLPDGWTSIVLRRAGADVVRWNNTGSGACVANVTFGEVPTDLPQMWRDAWCSAPAA